MRTAAIPGLYLQQEEGGPAWTANSEVKRRHFYVDGYTLKIFGRRGKTYKGQLNLLTVSALRPTTDTTAPTGALELQVRTSRTRCQKCVIVPDHSADDLFMALGNAVPSHATSEDLWQRHMGSRPLGGAGSSMGPTMEYRLGKTLGSGTFGKVKLAQRSDGAMFAVKVLNRARIVNASQSGRLAKEIRLLKLLNHPNVIRLYEVLHTPSDILMVMEYVEGGDLLEVLNTQRRFREDEVRSIFGQICCGVSFCHSLGVAHRDLKPENILLKRAEDGTITIKVADFGLSTLMQTGGMLSTACGSPHYVAPEILNFNGAARYDGRESDVWSLGVILHVLLCYKLPFEADSTQLLYKKIRQGLPSLPAHLSAPAQELLRGMLEVVPDRRLSLVSVVSHSWLQLGGTMPPLSQVVDAVVDIDHNNWLADGTADLISASKIFHPHQPNGEASECRRVRRAFTFDTLPRSFSDMDLHFSATRGGRHPRRSPRSSPLSSPRGAARQASPHSVSPHSASPPLHGIEGAPVPAQPMAVRLG